MHTEKDPLLNVQLHASAPRRKGAPAPAPAFGFGFRRSGGPPAGGPEETRSAADMYKASIFEVKPFHLGMFQGEELDAVQFRFSEFFSSLDAPVRIMALSEPYSLQGAVDSAHSLSLAAGERWRRDGLKQYRRFMEDLSSSTDLHGIKYYLQAWLPPDVQANTVRGLASSAFMTRVDQVEVLEPFFRGQYREEQDHLAPLTRGEPFMSVLTSWDLRGTWDLYTVHALLQLKFPVGLAVEIDTYTPDRAHITLMNAYNALDAQLGTSGRMGRDTRSESAWADCDYAMKAVDAGQRLHRTVISLLVKARSLGELRSNVQFAERVMLSKVRFRMERGSQLEALKLFTPVPANRIGVKFTRRTAVSEGVSVLVPFGLRRRNSTSGILWGIDADGGYPVFYDGWNRQNRPAHHGADASQDAREHADGYADGHSLEHALEHGYRDGYGHAGALGSAAPDGTSAGERVGPLPGRGTAAAAGGAGTEGASAFHHVIVGETGSGKTYGANLLLLREALRGTQVVVLEPIGHSRRLMRAMGEGGSYNRVDFANTAVNLLDVVEQNMADQVTHVQRALAVLLSSASGGASSAQSGSIAGIPGTGGTGHISGPGGGTGWGGAGRRVFTNAELAALGAALRDLYSGIDPNTVTPAETPRLQDLCHRLYRNSGIKGAFHRRRSPDFASHVESAPGTDIGFLESKRHSQRTAGRSRHMSDGRASKSSDLCGIALADEIAGLYVDGVYGDVFNPKHGTTLNLQLTSPGVAYDFSRVNDTFRPLLYSQVLAAVQRRVRSKKRRQPMIVFIDEFRYMSQEPMLAEQAMLLVKTARTYAAAIWMAEQNLFTFSESFTGRAIIENTPIVTLYRQTATATRIARELYPRLTEYHTFLLGTSQRGECITLLGDDIFHMYMQSSAAEMAAFSGT